MFAALLVLLALAAMSMPVSSLDAMAAEHEPTRKFEIRDDRAYLDDRAIDIWGIRAGNGLMSQAVTERFVRNLDNMAEHGINAIAVYIMGSNTGWPDEWAARNGFYADGRLRPEFAARLEWLIREANKRDMVVGVGIFTPRNVANLDGMSAYERALLETGRFLEERGLRNVFVDLMHEYSHRRVTPELFREPDGERKKSQLHQWFRTANAEVPAGVCATMDSGTAPHYPGADLNIIQKTMPIPASGYTINIESHKRDNYDTDGVYTAESIREQIGWLETYKQTPNAGFFLHAGFIQGVTGGSSTAPHAEMGGYGTADDPGVRWYYDWIRDNVGRWEFPRHVPERGGRL